MAPASGAFGQKDLESWAELTAALGFTAAEVGEQVEATAGVPPLAGLVERVGEVAYPEELLLRLEKPASGLAHLFAMPMRGQVVFSLRIFLYGDAGATAAARDEPQWRAWLAERFS